MVSGLELFHQTDDIKKAVTPPVVNIKPCITYNFLATVPRLSIVSFCEHRVLTREECELQNQDNNAHKQYAIACMTNSYQKLDADPLVHRVSVLSLTGNKTHV